MKLLQVTILCLLSSPCSSVDSQDVKTSVPLMTPATETLVTTAKPFTDLAEKSTVGPTSNGTTNDGSSQTPPLTTLPSFTTTVKSEGPKIDGVTKNELITTKETVTKPPSTNVTTVQSSQHKSENQNSIETTKKPVSSPKPDVTPSETSLSPLVSAAMTENISQSQGTENAKNVSSATTSSSYSSIILPVVIALIVITLSAFVLVGLYRMCWKTDPGTPENGNDQPQSDKESVKLLTVKTISHETGEHSAQGKTKN